MKISFKKRLPESRRPVQSEPLRAQVFSYHARRSQELGATSRKPQRDSLHAEASQTARVFFGRFGLLIVIIATFASLINVMMLSSDPEVLPLDTTQTSFLHDSSVYQKAAASLFAQSLTNHNKLTVDTDGISISLKHEFPELAVVSIRLPLLSHRPIIYIELTQPVLSLSTTSGQTFIIDQEGRALALATRATLGTLRLVNVKDESGALVAVGQPVLATDTVSFIQTVLFELQQRHLSVSSFTLPTGTSELDLYLSGQHYLVKFNLADSSSALQQVGTFLAVQRRLAEQNTMPAQYIDVRIVGRAYYK